MILPLNRQVFAFLIMPELCGVCVAFQIVDTLSFSVFVSISVFAHHKICENLWPPKLIDLDQKVDRKIDRNQ